MEKLTRITLDKSVRAGYTVAIESAIEIKNAQLYLWQGEKNMSGLRSGRKIFLSIAKKLGIQGGQV